jgi:hypothetical protein
VAVLTGANRDRRMSANAPHALEATARTKMLLAMPRAPGT